MRLAWHCLALVLTLVTQAQGLALRGTVHRDGQKALPLAVVRVLSLDGTKTLGTCQADSAGAFKVSTASEGFVKLVANGVGHQEFSLVLPAKGRSLDITLRLASDPIAITKPEAVEIMADGKLGRRVPMVKQADGAWAATVEAKGTEFRYEVAGVTSNGHTINGTNAMRYEYDGDSDYLSVVPVVDGKAMVQFDPKAFPFSPEPASITFKGDAPLNRYATVMAQLHAADAQLMKILRNAKPGDRIVFHAEAETSWAEALQTEKDPLARQALWLALSQFGPKGFDYSDLPKELPADSVFFKANPQAALYAPDRMPEGPARQTYETDIFRNLDGHSAEGFVKSQLAMLIYEGKSAEATTKLSRFESTRPGLPIYAKLKAQIASTGKVAVGASVPEFHIAALNDAKTDYSPASFKGKYLLLDFWATWCGPCRAEMPKLHTAYAEFHPRGLEVLSLSFDLQSSDITPYRKDAAHPMPWHHAFVVNGFQSDLAKAFAVTGIPKPILVGPDGKIVAMGESLRGDDLEKTLAKFLPQFNPAKGAQP